MYRRPCDHHGRLLYCPGAASLGERVCYLGLSCRPDRKGLSSPLGVTRTCTFKEVTGWPERISSGCRCCSLSRLSAPTPGSSAEVPFKLWPPKTWARAGHKQNRPAIPPRAETGRWLCICAPGPCGRGPRAAGPWRRLPARPARPR